jgi:predicted nucleic acid-binding protein
LRYWDSSALVPLLLEEARTEDARRYQVEDPEVVTWWGSRIECRSAVYREVHTGRLPRGLAAQAEAVLERLSDSWYEVGCRDAVREAAERLLRTHPLRAGEALQLGAALVVAEYKPSSLPFVCFDERLGDAARLEGFGVKL